MNEKEFKEVNVDGVEFSEKDDGRMIVQGILSVADEVNSNGRLYPRSVLNAAKAAYEKKIEKGRSTGSLDHSMGLRDASHSLQRLWWDGAKLMGELLVLRTPAGEKARELIKSGQRPGLSTRGKGQSKQVMIKGRETDQILPGYQLDAVDLVQDPSVLKAGIVKVIREHKEEEEDWRISEVKRKAKLIGEVK